MTKPPLKPSLPKTNATTAYYSSCTCISYEYALRFASLCVPTFSRHHDRAKVRILRNLLEALSKLYPKRCVHGIPLRGSIQLHVQHVRCRRRDEQRLEIFVHRAEPGVGCGLARRGGVQQAAGCNSATLQRWSFCGGGHLPHCLPHSRYIITGGGEFDWRISKAGYVCMHMLLKYMMAREMTMV